MKLTDIAAPDYFHKVVDCQWACPAHTPVPEYIRLIAQGRYGDAEEWTLNIYYLATISSGELQAADDYLDQAVFLLGEEVYAARLSNPVLAALYPRLDKAS